MTHAHRAPDGFRRPANLPHSFAGSLLMFMRVNVRCARVPPPLRAHFSKTPRGRRRYIRTAMAARSREDRPSRVSAARSRLRWLADGIGRLTEPREVVSQRRLA